MNLILKGSTDVTRYVKLVDSAAGTPETSYTITNLDLQYTRNRTAPAAKADATALAATDSAHADNKAIEIDGTSSPGLYRVDWPDAAFATGVDKVILCVSGTGLDPVFEEIQLVNFNPEDGVRLGLTALPNAAADAAGGLPISDAGGLDLDAQIGTDIDAILADTGTDGVVLANGAISAAKFAAGAVDAAALNADAVDEILDETIGDGTITMRQALRVLVAAHAAKLSGAATTTVTIRNVADSQDVIVATVDADGNRTATTVTP